MKDETKPENVIPMIPLDKPVPAPVPVTLAHGDIQNYVRQWAQVKFSGKPDYHAVYGILTDFVADLLIDINKAQNPQPPQTDNQASRN